MIRADWIAVDWGTSNLRAWAMGPDGAVLAQAGSADGMGALARDAFEPALLRLVAPWLGDGATDVVACGMVGSRQGWVEAGYARVPAAPLGRAPVRARAADARLRVHVLGGIAQDTPPDVMRGEETQIAGFLAAAPDFAGVMAMPGTHTKWVQIVDGEVFHFATFMTGELFALLSRNSVLHHTVDPDGDDPEAFGSALHDAMARPERVAAHLFSLRAEALLHGLSPARAGARLSGLLLGLELAGARPYWLGQNIALMASGPLLARYGAAFEAVGVAPRIADPESCVLDGLRAARRALQTRKDAPCTTET